MGLLIRVGLDHGVLATAVVLRLGSGHDGTTRGVLVRVAPFREWLSVALLAHPGLVDGGP